MGCTPRVQDLGSGAARLEGSSLTCSSNRCELDPGLWSLAELRGRGEMGKMVRLEGMGRGVGLGE